MSATAGTDDKVTVDNFAGGGWCVAGSVHSRKADGFPRLPENQTSADLGLIAGLNGWRPRRWPLMPEMGGGKNRRAGQLWKTRCRAGRPDHPEFAYLDRCPDHRILGGMRTLVQPISVSCRLSVKSGGGGFSTPLSLRWTRITNAAPTSVF